MNISTTSIKHKRYSQYGWNVKDNGLYRNTLAQGEIGILLCNQDPVTKHITQVTKDNFNDGIVLNHIFEVRLGTRDNQYFFDAMLLGADDFGVK